VMEDTSTEEVLSLGKREGQVAPAQFVNADYGDENIIEVDYKIPPHHDEKFIVYTGANQDGFPQIFVAEDEQNFHHNMKPYSDENTAAFIEKWYDPDCDNTDFWYYGKEYGDLWRSLGSADLSDDQIEQIENRMEELTQEVHVNRKEDVKKMVKDSLGEMLQALYLKEPISQEEKPLERPKQEFRYSNKIKQQWANREGK